MVVRVILQNVSFRALCLVWALLPGPGLADTLGDAIAATGQGDYENALNLWKELANKGNGIARYNLGLFYKRGLGVSADSQLADFWFAQAANSGVIDGYHQLTAAAIKPGKIPLVELALDPESWIRAQNPRNYTLQLASSSSLKLIEGYYYGHALEGQAGYFLNKQQGRYALVFGTFGSVAEATEAINLLPEELRKWSPWVRRFREIHKNMDNAN